MPKKNFYKNLIMVAKYENLLQCDKATTSSHECMGGIGGTSL